MALRARAATPQPRPACCLSRPPRPASAHRQEGHARRALHWSPREHRSALRLTVPPCSQQQELQPG
eukprot:scaffold132781_cov69-Phaeocystis_antarctica.AAC.1